MEKKEPQIPEPFKPHPHLDDEVNKRIIESEIKGGIMADSLKIGHFLEIETQNRVYTLERRTDGLYISGHPKFCPEPTKVRIQGSTWGGSMLKAGFIGRGMRLEYIVPGYEGPITTSKIEDIKEFKTPSDAKK